MSPPRLSDPASSPRFPFRGEVKRQKPIWTREQFGPWECDVRVIPITGMRAGYPVFEVNCHWKKGPPLDESLGPTPAGGMEAADVYYVDRMARDLPLGAGEAAEFAVELGKRAADLLADAAKPDLRALARAMIRRRRG